MANGLLSPVEKQTQSVFGMVPMEERLSLLPRYSKTQGLIAPQFIYELAKAVSTPIVAMRGDYVSPEETLNVPLSSFAGSSLGNVPIGSLKSGIGKNALSSAKEMLNKPKEGVWNGEKPLDMWKAEQQARMEAEKNAPKSGLLPSPQSLSMPSVPTAEQMKQFGRVEVVPLSKAVSFQSARNWEKFNAGKHPGDLVPGFGDKPLALRLETGEYVIYDGNHRTDLALRKGKTELPMHVIDVKSYDPAHAGRKPVPPSMSDDEILSILFGSNKK